MRSALKILLTALLVTALLVVLQGLLTVPGMDHVAARIAAAVIGAGLLAGAVGGLLSRPTAGQAALVTLVSSVVWAVLGAAARTHYGYDPVNAWTLLWWVVTAISVAAGLLAGRWVRGLLSGRGTGLGPVAGS